jgi:tRNA 2-(methylsulfanyl)-N6-isopentenyladenosine37 hydroxylase
MSDLAAIRAFLRCETPTAWATVAAQEIPTLLMDHANCEKKAASTAMTLMYRYVDKPDLLEKMSHLAREELLHFEQVVGFMRKRNIAYQHLGPARYAAAMRSHIRTHEPARLVDTMIIGAFVEARSCERFAMVAPLLEPDLQKFYLSLLRSEARHFTDYLGLARLYANEDIEPRIAFFAEVEQALISSEDALFRFHSGIPAADYSVQ